MLTARPAAIVHLFFCKHAFYRNALQYVGSELMEVQFLRVIRSSHLRGTVRASGMGLVCGGLHALGPDHLATLVTFSALRGRISSQL